MDWQRATAPRDVALQPGTRSADGSYADGVLRATVPRIDVHEIVVVRD